MQGKDQINIKVVNPILFFSEETLSTIKNETAVQLDIPLQIALEREEEVVSMEENANTVKESSSMFMGGSFVVNILLAGSLSLLWGLINSLQLVTHFPLTNLIFPTNAKTYFGVMFEIANFDLIPTDELEDIVDEEVGEADQSETFDPSTKLSDSTIEAGYDSANVILSSTLNLLILSSAIGVAVIVIILRIFCFKV